MFSRHRIQQPGRYFRINVSVRQTHRRVNKLKISPIVIRDCHCGLCQFDMTAFRQLRAVLVGSDFYLTREESRKPQAIQKSGAGLVADSVSIPRRHAFQRDLIDAGSNGPECCLPDTAVNSLA